MLMALPGFGEGRSISKPYFSERIDVMYGKRLAQSGRDMQPVQILSDGGQVHLGQPRIETVLAATVANKAS